MRIAFDAKRLFNNFTGLGNHSRTTIDMLSRYYPDDELILYSPRMKHNAVTDPYLNMNNVVTRRPHGLVRGSLWRTAVIASEAVHSHSDVFHGLSNELPYRLNLPSVVTIHDLAFKTFTRMYHRQDRLIYSIKWKHAIDASTRIIAISDCTRRDIIEYYDVDPAKIDVVYQPVSLRYYQDIDPNPEVLPVTGPYMLYVGTVNSRKNLLGVVKAMQQVPVSVRLPLVVVGSGRDYLKKVRDYVARNGMEQWVIFPSERVSDDELHQLYRNATLFVYPSFYEGFGLPVVEAALCHCPVLTSNVSSLPEAGGPSAMLVDPSSIDDIAAKMEQLLTDDALRTRMSHDAHDYAMATFHPQTLAQQLHSVYERAIK